ncbi:hypothetical protein K1719_021192 [Acacia pycnantha]|nr:hypothetical protein K1719_021192 [Acacia pycnantha]
MDEIQISTPIVWKDVETARILIGKVLASKSYTRSTMETILSKAWNLQSGFEMHNIPLEAFSVENDVAISGHVREVLIAEDPRYNGRYLRNFLRARIMLDLRKPLAYGFWLLKPDGRKIWIALKYEKLQTFCYNCRKVGHDNRVCQSVKLMSNFKMNEPRYGAWITMTVCRNWEETLTVLNSEEAEASYVKRKKDAATKEGKAEDQQKSSVEPPRGRRIFSLSMCHCNSGEGSGTRKEERSKPLARGKMVESMEVIDPQSMLSRDNSMAMVLYSEQEIKSVIDGLCNLGLKRTAEESWDSGKPKRRKASKESAGPLMNISNYASNLRRTKSKSRRGGRKKNPTREEGDLVVDDSDDRSMEENSMYDFVFKARSGKRKEMTADDHHVLLIDLCFCDFKSPRAFRFEATWVQHADFLEVVKEGWTDGMGLAENRILGLVSRLEACKEKLMRWSRNAFPNFRRLIDQLKQQLNRCNSGILTEQLVAEAEEVTRKLEEAWSQEEMQRNKILKLKDERGIWLEEREEINTAFDAFYRKLFYLVGARPMEQALAYVSKVVTEEDNNSLMISVTSLEI